MSNTNTDLTLDTLMANLGIEGFTKSASEQKPEDEEKGKKSAEADKSNRPDPDKKDEDEGKEKPNESKSEAPMTKEASIQAGIALALQITQGMQKQAALVPEEQQAIADAQAPAFQPNPQGTKEEVAAQVIQRLQAAGATPDDQTQAAAPATPKPVVPEAAATAQVAVATGEVATSEPEESEELQKVAAVLALVDEGVDFDNAVAMVKQAEYAIDAENQGLMKQAAMQELMASGHSFDDAAVLIKQACAEEAPDEDLVKLAFLAEAMDQGLNFEDSLYLLKEASLVPEEQQAIAAAQAPAFQPNPQGTKEDVAAQVLQRLQAAGATPDDQTQTTAPATPKPVVAGAAGVAMSEQEKQAFCLALMDNGLDFSAAASLVNRISGN